VITIRLNGAAREVREGATLGQLVRELALAPEQVAVERNGRIVRRVQHDSIVLAAADEIELVTLVGGG